MSKDVLVGPPKPFDPKVDDFASWYETFESFLEANGVRVNSSTSPGSSPRPEETDDLQLDSDTESRPNSPEQLEDRISPPPSLILVGVDDNASEVFDVSHPVEPVTKVDRPGFFGSGDASATFSLHKRRKLTPTLRGMIGEAHLRFARGEQAMAAELCMEVIKESA